MVLCLLTLVWKVPSPLKTLYWVWPLRLMRTWNRVPGGGAYGNEKPSAERTRRNGPFVRNRPTGPPVRSDMDSTVSLTAELGVRLALIGALLTAVGVTSYGATHWEPRAYHAPKQDVSVNQSR